MSQRKDIFTATTGSILAVISYKAWGFWGVVAFVGVIGIVYFAIHAYVTLYGRHVYRKIASGYLQLEEDDRPELMDLFDESEQKEILKWVDRLKQNS